LNQKFENLLRKYYTGRIDIKNYGGSDNNFIILNNSDETSNVSQPGWFNDHTGVGTMIESLEGILDLKIKCVNDGLLKIYLRSIDSRDVNGKKFPTHIDFINFSVNDDIIFNNSKLVWHDNPYMFSKKVHDSEVIDIHIEWLPFNSYSEFNVDESLDSVLPLKEKLALRERQLKSIPQLSATTLGFSALGGKITYRNLFPTPNGILDDLQGYCEKFWVTRFIKDKFPDEDFKINIFGVHNTHDNLAYPMDGKKVFFSIGEDINYRFLEMKYNFDKYAFDYVDLSMGSDIVDHPKYIRFPFWMLSIFAPESTEEDIERRVDSWNLANYEKSKNVAAIASHDWWGTRSLIANDVNKFTNIEFAGKWNNNTSDLFNQYNNNKLEYLKEFKFNLCAENLITDAYVTEKIFHAIDCDCIPLYAGGGNYLEPKILNPDAIVRWTGEKKYGCDPGLLNRAHRGLYAKYPVKWVANDNLNSDSVELFKNLLTDKKTYDEFKDQDRVLSSSKKYIMKIFLDLEKHFERLIYS